ncbi:GRAS family protein RAD1-like [Salvia miltiorrhiza]|uniref:GRAS family protein RAD1-like n=1 Tax=Salvia miltiorrhiza TaxID=226208 RepID=UPI0025ACA826|nr:GRAS family protein RAD1-like [Salvia miltiorrhiza]
MAYSFLPQDSFDDDFKNFPIFEDVIGAIWLPSLHDGAGDFKRQKKTTSLTELSDGGGGGGSVSIPRNGSAASLTSSGPQIRDRIKTYSQLYLEAEALAAEDGGRGGEGAEGGNADGTKLVQQLISCAEAVACRDRAHASLLLSELRANALVFGSAFQRVASCFVQGLADRLAMVQPLGAVGYAAPTMNIMDAASEKREEALRLVYDMCPYIRFGHFVANAAILEAFEGERLVHVVDLGMTLGLPQGHQWQNLIHSLAKRPGPPPRLRVTAVGLCRDRFREIGGELEACAAAAGVKFGFSVVHSNLESLTPADVKVERGEVVVVNTILQLHCVVKESRGALNAVLQIVHELSPKVMVVVEQDSSHNGPFFLGRFMEALHYYAAIFDSLDAVLPKYDTRRAKMEQFYFAEEIKNIVSCEGPARVERHERVDQWRRRMSRAGFQPVPLKMAAQAKQWLGSINAGEGYTTVEEKGCLVLGWKSKPIIAASCWKC